MTLLAGSLPPAVLTTGAITGLAYAVLAVGIVVVYRASRVINIAHIELGALAATLLAKLVIDYHWNWVIACVVVSVGGAAAGAVIELAIVRRLFTRPRAVVMVATMGLSGLLFVGRLTVTFDRPASTFPLPFDRHLTFGSVTIHSAGLLAVAVLPAVLVSLGVFLAGTPDGAVIRSVAENPDAARLAGIPVKRVSTTVWAIGGFLAAIGVVASAGLVNLTPALAQPAAGPSLFLPVLAAALVGRLRSVVLTVIGGLAIGVAEAVLLHHFDRGARDLVFALVIGAVLVAMPARRAGARGLSSFPVVARSTRVPAAVSELRWFRRLRRLPLIAGGLVAVVAPVVITTPSTQQTFSRIAVFAMVVISVTVLLGWAGQFSLGQYGFVGCGAASTAALVERGLPFGVAVVYAVVGGAALALVVGLPAVRAGGLFLAVTTLGFAVAAHSFVVPHLLGERTVVVPRAVLGPIDFADQRAYYYLCLAALAVTVAVTDQLRRGGVGRSIMAVRDNEVAAAGYGVSPIRMKLVVFVFSGSVATFAGALLAGLDVQVTSSAFSPDESLRAVATAIIGGLGSLPGALVGAAWAVGLPAFAGDSTTARLLTTAPFLLVLLLYLPGGFVDLAERAKLALATWVDRRIPVGLRPGHGLVGGEVEQRGSPRERVDDLATSADEAGALDGLDGQSGQVGSVPAALVVSDVHVRFGGIAAVDGVSIEVRPGEVVGLIGANGAGKSTLVDAISGFVPATGTVVVLGERVIGWSPARRVRAGLGRTFQNGGLFGNLTVHETVSVALESRAPSHVVPSMLALPPARRGERAKQRAASEYIDSFGLGPHDQTLVSELSTGMRRVVELACLVALGNRMLVLDEPTAGLAQAEVDAFAPLITRLRADLGASVLIIEHDLPLISAVCDRVYCMSEGRIIANARPDEIVHDSEVVAAYLGSSTYASRR